MTSQNNSSPKKTDIPPNLRVVRCCGTCFSWFPNDDAACHKYEASVEAEHLCDDYLGRIK